MNIEKIYIGHNPLDASGEVIHIAELIETPVKNFRDMFDSFFKVPMKGHKQEYYTTIANHVKEEPADSSSSSKFRQKPFRRHYNSTQMSAQFIAYDGDATKANPNSCVPIKEIKAALDFYKYNYILYTTHSHLNNNSNIRWRILIPCYMTSEAQLKPTVSKLFKELEAKCPDLKWTNESVTWSQPWFLSLRDDPEDGLHEAYFNDSGRDFEACEACGDSDAVLLKENVKTKTLSGRSQEELVRCIVQCEHPVHESVRDWIKGQVCDSNRQHGHILGDLMGMTSGWPSMDISQDHLKYREDFDRQVKTAIKKYREDAKSCHWDTEYSDTDRIFTKYPSLGGRMEEYVQECMSWMIFPNRQIAVTAVRGLISAMGARTYTLPDGKGINLTALITGRSTIGKSNIKKFFIWALDNIALTKFSQFYLGAQHYTSPKNLVDDLREKTALYSVRTESGQSDKSSAGDMPRVMNYELEFATEGGKGGYVSRGGQNRTRNGDETLPALYSPPVTTIRESVAQIQNDADILNQSTVAGVTGRRSVILIDPIKAQRNYDRPEKPSKKLKELILNLHKLASDTAKKDCTVPMPEDAWIILKSEDSEFLKARENDWLTQENKAAANGENLSSTFFGRLYERVPAFAGILAIAENPLMPIITNEQYKIAEQCLYNEFQALNEQNSDGSLNGYWGVLEQKVVNIFKGDMTKFVTRYPKSLQEIAVKELKDGAIEQTVLFRILQHTESFITAKSQKGFSREFEDRCAALNIHKMKEHEVKEKYNHKRCVYWRI